MKHTIIFFVTCSLVAFLTGCGKTDSPVAKILKISGLPSYMYNSSSSFKKAEEGQNLAEGGSVKTTDEGSVELEFIKDKTNIKIGQLTYFEIKNFSKKELKQMGGSAIYSVSPQDKELSVETPHGMATVLGTVFHVEVNASYTQLTVEKGTVKFAWKKNIIKVRAGEFVNTKSKKEYSPRPVDPMDLEKIFGKANTKINYNSR